MVQEIITHSWGSRLVQSLWGILFGIGLIIASFVLVFWNEGNGLHTAESLMQAEKLVVAVPNAPIDVKNDQKVVYFTGILSVNELLSDQSLGVSSKAIKLIRHVEMYQWHEQENTRTEKNVGGSQTEIKEYSYSQDWSESIVSSERFKDRAGHQNPASMKLKSVEQYAKQIKVGDFILPSVLSSQISGETPVDLSKVDIEKLSAQFKQPVHFNDDGLYVGKDPQLPEVGDLKIKLFEILPQLVSVIAQQTQNTLQPYKAPSEHEVALLSMGEKSARAMFQEALDANAMMTWILRLVSFLMMIIGFSLILKPLSVFGDVLPFVGTIIGVGTGLIAFLIGFVLWITATAIAWFIVRPILSVVLVVSAIAVSYAIYKAKKPKIKTI